MTELGTTRSSVDRTSALGGTSAQLVSAILCSQPQSEADVPGSFVRFASIGGDISITFSETNSPYCRYVGFAFTLSCSSRGIKIEFAIGFRTRPAATVSPHYSGSGARVSAFRPKGPTRPSGAGGGTLRGAMSRPA